MNSLILAGTWQKAQGFPPLNKADATAPTCIFHGDGMFLAEVDCCHIVQRHLPGLASAQPFNQEPALTGDAALARSHTEGSPVRD